jgi:hypothetical protein
MHYRTVYATGARIARKRDRLLFPPFQERDKMNKYRIYVGPTLVAPIAAILRDAGFSVFLEGTEHVFIATDEPISSVLAVLPTWQARDIISL